MPTMTQSPSAPAPTASEAVCHRWKELPEDRPMDGITRRRIIGSQMMISEVRLRKGTFVPMHSHANEQFACIMNGSLLFEVGTAGTPGHRKLTVRAGEVLHLPSHVPHSALAEEDTLVLDMFSPPSEKTGVDRH